MASPWLDAYSAYHHDIAVLPCAWRLAWKRAFCWRAAGAGVTTLHSAGHGVPAKTKRIAFLKNGNITTREVSALCCMFIAV